MRDESNNDYGNNYLQAEPIIDKFMQSYNQKRLHAALGYMTPTTWHRGHVDGCLNPRDSGGTRVFCQAVTGLPDD